MQTDIPDRLLMEIASQCDRDVAWEYGELVSELRSRFHDSVDALILYGSCLRNNDIHSGIIDLYVIVGSYRSAYTKKSLRFLNRLLPPNVFYLESGNGPEKLRIKYTVISMADFRRGAVDWFHSYIWARFAQPVRLLYARNNKARGEVHEVLALSALRFLRASIPLSGECQSDAATIWTRGFSCAYAAELRPENRNRASQLVNTDLDVYTRLLTYAVPAMPDLIQMQAPDQFICRAKPALQQQVLKDWQWRRRQGRILSILRLAKATLTFRNPIDYAAWKIERHTGVRIQVTPFMQRYPLLKGPAVLFQLIRNKVLR